MKYRPRRLRQPELETGFALAGGRNGGPVWPIDSAFEIVRTQDYFSQDVGNFATDALGLHALLIDTAMSNWRRYMIWLTQQVNEGTNKYLVMSYDFVGGKIGLDEQQRLKELENFIIDIEIAMLSMLDTIDSFLSIGHRQTTPAPDHDPIMLAVHHALKEKRREAQGIKDKANRLKEKAQGTSQLMYHFLCLDQSYDLKHLVEGSKTEIALTRILAKETRKEGSFMRFLAEKSTQDTAIMKVFTFVALIFLPLSAVASIFSTEFVQQIQAGPDDDKQGFKISMAQNVWLLVAIVVPLTCATLFMSYIWICCYGRKRCFHDEENAINAYKGKESSEKKRSPSGDSSS
ncbi:hypothetical protein UCRPC4_g00600 [Phaeomoniella chlamydospora]|uniref:Uncharacterized protein n=1 Tax=Phaeomoniella chlamydospora TaxID=158046 RepID=A0A0G2GZ80_PHACM|nr:hypothetical protein UCRPC4_g00600 [Phaeomoniella chlamydospora]